MVGRSRRKPGHCEHLLQRLVCEVRRYEAQIGVAAPQRLTLDALGGGVVDFKERHRGMRGMQPPGEGVEARTQYHDLRRPCGERGADIVLDEALAHDEMQREAGPGQTLRESWQPAPPGTAHDSHAGGDQP